MNILIVYPYWTYPEVAIEFLVKMARRGHKITAIYAGDKKESIKAHNLNKNNITIYEVQHLDLSLGGKITKKYPYFLNFKRILSSIECDVIVIQLPLFLTTIQALKIAEKLRKPTVVEVHGVYAHRNLALDLAQKTYLYTIGQWEFKKATLVRCLTKEDAQEIMHYGAPYYKIRIVPNPVDTELFKPSLNRNDEVLIWTGRMVVEKGLTYLIKALDIVVHEYKHKEIQLLIVGDGPQRYLIMKLIKRYNLKSNVSLLGVLPRKRVAEYLSKASIFVFPSIKEGMPFSLLEALSSGLPVIGTNVSGVRNLIVHGYNGLLVPPKDPKAIAEAISYLLDNRSLRLKMSKSAREFIIANFSYQKILPKLEQLYNEAIEVYH